MSAVVRMRIVGCGTEDEDEKVEVEMGTGFRVREVVLKSVVVWVVSLWDIESVMFDFEVGIDATAGDGV